VYAEWTIFPEPSNLEFRVSMTVPDVRPAEEHPPIFKHSLSLQSAQPVQELLSLIPLSLPILAPTIDTTVGTKAPYSPARAVTFARCIATQI
jgi:hypothetical protein